MTMYTEYFSNVFGEEVVKAAIKIAEEIRHDFYCCRGRGAAVKKSKILTTAAADIKNWAEGFGVPQIYFQEITGFSISLKRFMTKHEMEYGISCGAWKKTQKRQRFYLA